jgi:hypothetical protein
VLAGREAGAAPGVTATAMRMLLVIDERKQRIESMKRFKLLFVAVAAVLALAGMATSSALASGPTLLFHAGEGPTILLRASSATHKTELQSEATTLKGEGDLTELTLLQTSTDIVGIYSALFTNVFQGTEKCKTKGDPTGEVLLPQNTLLVVYWSTASGALQAGIVFHVNEFTIECGAEPAKIMIKGSVLGSITKETEAFKTTIKGGLHCLTGSRGKPEKSAYTNSKGEALNAKLEATAAKKTSEACEEIEGEESFVTEAGSSSKEAELMF